MQAVTHSREKAYSNQHLARDFFASKCQKKRRREETSFYSKKNEKNLLLSSVIEFFLVWPRNKFFSCQNGNSGFEVFITKQFGPKSKLLESIVWSLNSSTFKLANFLDVKPSVNSWLSAIYPDDNFCFILLIRKWSHWEIM